MGILDRLEKAQAEGRIGHAGFSFHDHYQVLKSIVQAYDRWALCSVEYSYMDVNHDPGANGIRLRGRPGPGRRRDASRSRAEGSRKSLPRRSRQIWARSPREWSSR